MKSKTLKKQLSYFNKKQGNLQDTEESVFVKNIKLVVTVHNLNVTSSQNQLDSLPSSFT